MKHVKRSDCRKQTRNAIMEHYCDFNEPVAVEMQINEAWEAKEREEADRIKKEINISWKEYEAEASKDAFDREDNFIAEIEEYFKTLDEIDESEVEYLYQKNSGRGLQRRKTAHANKQLLINAKNANKNMARRKEDDLKNYVEITEKDPEKGENDWENLRINSRKEFKSRVAKTYALLKRAKKLQR